MKKMNVLHYIPGFNTGGIESVFLNWFRHIDKTQINFELLVRSYDPESPLLKEYLASGGKLHTLATPSLNPKTMFAFYRKVRRFFKTHPDFDFLHVHVADDPFVVDVAKKSGIEEVAIHAHTTGYNESYKSQGLKSKIRTHNVNAAQHHIAITQAAAKWMFPEEGNVRIIHNGIDTKAYLFDENVRENYRKQLQIDNQYVIMHVGRFSEVKNHLFMLDLFEKVTETISHARMVFVGDGPLQSDIQAEVNERKLQHQVDFLGPRGDVPALLQAADIFLLPSKFEGLGLSAVEAQAAGLPTIVSDRVPTEVAITDLVTFLSLEAPLADWVQVIQDYSKQSERKDTSKEVQEAHYDISQTVRDLSEFYLSTYRK